MELTQADVLPDDSANAVLRCRAGAVVEVETAASQNGSITVQVREGNAIPVFDQTFGPGAATHEETLGGGVGHWELRVHRTLEFDAPFTARLWC